MKVILLRDMVKLGKRGTVAEVADGYALNVLIRQGDAVQATPAELTKWKQAADKKEREKDKASQIFYDMKESLSGQKPVITVSKHDNGHLFAAIAKEDIAQAIFEITKVSLSPKQIESAAMKTLGDHAVTVTLGEKSFTVTVSVVSKK